MQTFGAYGLVAGAVFVVTAIFVPGWYEKGISKHALDG
jgi:hypothetical protein